MPGASGNSRNSLIILAVIASFAALYAAHWFFVPVTFALALSAMLWPVVSWLRRLGAPSPLAATVAVVASIGLLVVIGIALEPPLRDFAAQVPKSVEAARAKIKRMGGPFARIADAPIGGAAPSATGDSSAQKTPTAPSPKDQNAGPAGASQSMSIAQRIFGSTSSALTELVEVTLLALFVLAAGDAWSEKLARAVRDPERRRVVHDVVSEMRSVVARYFVVTMIINVGQALVIGFGLMLLGYPAPILWGVLTFLLEFIPYLGGMVMIVLLVIVGLASGGSLLHGVAGGVVYLTVTTLQNNLVSPIAYGRGLRINPAAILAGLMLFWGVWGVAGAFLAVPILAAFQVVARRVESLEGAAEFLAG